ncbi:MAG: glyceraldehyde 3-phosphate dehydrogenase NAD-binding domain-containing protein [Campylobacterota bacterium]|nr:glyceraldehyde 3-phosphate dehydrogenase NAD-binding domain-containing protein [Campylobacterota bacterium]
MKILLNGVGRIGKAIIRLSLKSTSFQIVAINELNNNIENIAYTLNYDSTYGKIKDKFFVEDETIKNKHHCIKVLNYNSLLDIDFKNIGVDFVIDASGSKIDFDFLKRSSLKAIFLTHPSKDADINIVLGVNEKKLDIKKHKIISTSSCNATALLPVLKLIDNKFKIKYGNITTIHPLLNHQKVLDSSCVGSFNRDIECNYGFGRSSVQNIIPSKTTTIEACSYVLDKIDQKKISSSSFRVPTATVGAIDILLCVKKSCDKKMIENLFLDYEKMQKYDILLNSYENMVSSDFQAERFTTIIDHRFTNVNQHKMIKLNVWYDNEWGYASKVVDIVSLYNKKEKRI